MSRPIVFVLSGLTLLIVLGIYIYRAYDDTATRSAIVLQAFRRLLRDIRWGLRWSGELVGAGFVSFADGLLSSPSDAHGSARFLRGLAKWQLLSLGKSGLVIDGKKRISRERSYEHLALIAPTGAGKTTAYILPNVLNLDTSMVITDPSGEIHQKTAGYLHQKGFAIKALNVGDVDRSLQFNPLDRAESHAELQKIAEILVRAAYPHSKGGAQVFWHHGAKTLLTILLRCLTQEPPACRNLRNLRYLLNKFGEDGEPLEDFIARNADPSTRSEWQGFVAQDKKTLQGVVAGAKTALGKFADPELCQLTDRETLRFESLRREPTALFIIVPEHEISYYGFFLTLLYTQLFNFAMEQPTEDEPYLPIYFLLDEFGNAGRIPAFDTLITTLRKRRCSLSLALQDVEQLRHTYGRAAASTILNNCASKLFLPGLSLETCRMVEDMLGPQTIEKEETGLSRGTDEPATRTREIGRPLMTADEVRTMADDEALFIHGNKRPVRLRTTPFYENRRLQRYTSVRSPSLPSTTGEDPAAGPDKLVPLSSDPQPEPEHW